MFFIPCRKPGVCPFEDLTALIPDLILGGLACQSMLKGFKPGRQSLYSGILCSRAVNVGWLYQVQSYYFSPRSIQPSFPGSFFEAVIASCLAWATAQK